MSMVFKSFLSFSVLLLWEWRVYSYLCLSHSRFLSLLHTFPICSCLSVSFSHFFFYPIFSFCCRYLLRRQTNEMMGQQFVKRKKKKKGIAFFVCKYTVYIVHSSHYLCINNVDGTVLILFVNPCQYKLKLF